jgi:two-component system nitrogen regulation response regulator GlnG
LGTILIVDDDAQLRQSFEKLLTEEGHIIQTSPTGEVAISMVRECAPDMVVMDVCLPGMNGLEAFKAIREIEPKLPVIVMTAFGTTETAIEATKLGAFEYVLKPFEIPEILALIDQALEAGRFMRSRVEIDVVPDVASAEAIIGRSKAMQEVYKAIGRVASTDATVLIRGESGTGKELVARALYQHSLRANNPFLVINCVAIPETLLESELFGYEKGAFTGAVSRRVGKIQKAHGGTVFLDEIGDMPFSIQAKILRLLQEKSIERLGGHEPISVDVRIIAATNRDLETAVAERRFREDLYYRLKVVTLWLPPMRDRLDDVRILADYFLTRFAREMGTDNPGMNKEAKTLLSTLPWPGNVRELANTIQKALILGRGGPINQEDISQAVGSEQVSAVANDTADKAIRGWVRKALAAGIGKDTFISLTDRFASIVIGEALNLTRDNRTQAAKLLGLSRPTLLSKIEKYRLKIETSVKSDLH